MVLLALWGLLAVLLVLYKSYPSPLMSVVFNVGWVSLFASGGIFLYRTSKRFRKR